MIENSNGYNSQKRERNREGEKGEEEVGGVKGKERM